MKRSVSYDVAASLSVVDLVFEEWKKNTQADDELVEHIFNEWFSDTLYLLIDEDEYYEILNRS